MRSKSRGTYTDAFRVTLGKVRDGGLQRCYGVEEWESVSAEEEMIPEMRLEGWKGVIQGKRRSWKQYSGRAQAGVPRTHSVHIRELILLLLSFPFPSTVPSRQLPVGQREHRGKSTHETHTSRATESKAGFELWTYSKLLLEGVVIHTAQAALRPGIKPMPSGRKRIGPNHWTAREVPSSLNDSCYFTQQNDPITVTVEYSTLIKQLTGYVVHSFPYLLMAPLKLATSESLGKGCKSRPFTFMFH